MNVTIGSDVGTDEHGVVESTFLRVTRKVLMGICVADVLLGAIILFSPALLFKIFNVALPDEMLWFQLIGLMLIPGAIYGWVGFRDRQRLQGVISGGSNLATAAFLLTVSSVRNVPLILIILAIAEAIVGILTLFYLVKLGRDSRAGG